MSKQGTIIVVDDNKGVLSAVKLLLKNHFEHIVTLPSPITLPAALREENAQVVLLDMNFSSGLNTGNEGLYWLHEIKKIHPSLPVVLFTAYADIDLAVRGIKEGATDFIVKPWDNARLIETLLSACRNSSKNKKRAEIPKTVSSMYWGESNAMKQLRTLIEKVAQTDANILITGENGTGKEMLAREIHALSNRYRRDMITVDMGAITESLILAKMAGLGTEWEPGWIVMVTTTVKIFIDMFIGIWALLLAYIWTAKFDKTRGDRTMTWGDVMDRFPRFVLGYLGTFLVLLIVCLSTPELHKVGKAMSGAMNGFRVIFFLMTFFSIGMVSNFRKLMEEGIGRLAIVYIVCLFGFIIWVGLFISYAFFHGMTPPVVGA